jgi:hypothetical protein
MPPSCLDDPAAGCLCIGSSGPRNSCVYLIPLPRRMKIASCARDLESKGLRVGSPRPFHFSRSSLPPQKRKKPAVGIQRESGAENEGEKAEVARPAQPVRLLRRVFSGRSNGRDLSSEVHAGEEMALPGSERCRGRLACELARFRGESHRDGRKDETRSICDRGSMVEESLRIGRCRLCGDRSPGTHVTEIRPIHVQHLEGDVDPHGQEGAKKDRPPAIRSLSLTPDPSHRNALAPSSRSDMILHRLPHPVNGASATFRRLLDRSRERWSCREPSRTTANPLNDPGSSVVEGCVICGEMKSVVFRRIFPLTWGLACWYCRYGIRSPARGQLRGVPRDPETRAF